MQIKAIRERQNIKQKDLANALGITQAYLCELERGRKKNPNPSLLRSIALELNATSELSSNMAAIKTAVTGGISWRHIPERHLLRR